MRSLTKVPPKLILFLLLSTPLLSLPSDQFRSQMRINYCFSSLLDFVELLLDMGPALKDVFLALPLLYRSVDIDDVGWTMKAGSTFARFNDPHCRFTMFIFLDC